MDAQSRSGTRKTLTSWRAAQDEITSIVARVNADPPLACAAALNPLLAVEELGYEIPPALRREFEHRVRFGEKTARRLEELRQQIVQHAGKEFDPDSEEELRSVLAHHMQLIRHDAACDAPLYDGGPGAAERDPLRELTGAHDILEPLLEYRRLQSTSPRLAEPALFHAVRQGSARTPLRKVTFRLRKGSRP
jgi:hypothetical protein